MHIYILYILYIFLLNTFLVNRLASCVCVCVCVCVLCMVSNCLPGSYLSMRAYIYTCMHTSVLFRCLQLRQKVLLPQWFDYTILAIILVGSGLVSPLSLSHIHTHTLSLSLSLSLSHTHTHTHTHCACMQFNVLFELLASITVDCPDETTPSPLAANMTNISTTVASQKDCELTRVCSSIHPSIHPSIYRDLNLFIHIFIYSSIYSYIHPCMHPFIHSYMHPLIHSSLH